MPNLLPHRFRGTAALFELNAVACLDPVPSKSLEMLNCNPGKAQHSHKSWSSAQKKQQLSYPLKFTTDEGRPCPFPDGLLRYSTVEEERLFWQEQELSSTLGYCAKDNYHLEPHFSHASPVCVPFTFCCL